MTSPTILHLRRDLRALKALEGLQLAAGVGALLAIAIRAVVVAGDLRAGISIAAITLLAVSYILLALRVRAGQELVRRDLYVMERDDELAKEARPCPEPHPYRVAAGGRPESEVVVPRRLRLVQK